MSKEKLSSFLRYIRIWCVLWLATKPPRHHLEIWLAELGKIRAAVKRQME